MIACRLSSLAVAGVFLASCHSATPSPAKELPLRPCNDVVRSAPDARRLATMAMVQRGFPEGLYTPASEPGYVLGAMLPASWPPQDCRARFYVHAEQRATQASSVPHAAIEVDLSNAHLFFARVESVQAGEGRWHTTVSEPRDDTMLAVIASRSAPARDDFVDLAHEVQRGLVNEALLAWHLDWLTWVVGHDVSPPDTTAARLGPFAPVELPPRFPTSDEVLPPGLDPAGIRR